MGYLKEDEISLDEVVCSGSLREAEELRKLYLKRFKENIKLANSVASKFSYPRDSALDFDDVLQEAYIGLWKACTNFDESKGFQFSTYAVCMIRGQILRMFRDMEPISIPRSYQNISRALSRHGFTLPLSEEEICILVDEKVAPRSVIARYMIDSPGEVASLDAPISDDSETTFGEMIPSKDSSIRMKFSDDEIEQAVDKILEYMKPDHKDLIEEWLYATLAGSPITQQELARKYNITQPHVGRILRYVTEVAKMRREEILNIFGV